MESSPVRSSRESRSRSLIARVPLGSSTWLLRLRWFAVAGQLITILVADWATSVSLPMVPLLLLVALTAVTNFVYGFWLSVHETSIETTELKGSDSSLFRDGEDESQHVVALALMLLDLVTLTAMLYFSGGVGNPFSLFYVVNLAVGGVMIRPRAAWCLTVTAIIGYAFLLQASLPIEGLDLFRPGGFGLPTKRVNKGSFTMPNTPARNPTSHHSQLQDLFVR
ncbi:MAG: hypothetical protein AAGI63_12155, partial [Planctomycetota bacterium]